MKYWKEKENNPVENMQFWPGTYITKLAENEIFLYGSNPQGINGAGAAKAAMSLSKGAKHGVGRGFNGSNAYALVTKSLNAGFLEKSTGILYDKEGYCSVSPEQIRTNIDELYEIAKSQEHKDKKFLVSYQYESWPNGTPKKSLNGYTSQEMLEMFVKDKDVPPNIVFHDSYKPHLEKLFKKESKQSNGDFVVYENDKTIDIKEEDIVWTIDSDERNPEGIHGVGGAKAALEFGAQFGNGRGLQGSSYALVTKNLNAGFIEKSTGITYHKDGYCSVSEEQIRININELYECAKQNQEKKFLITFQYESWPNGSPKKSLNGYTSEEMFQMFVRSDIPSNIVFHDSYKKRLELINTLKNDKTINYSHENKPKEYTFFFHLTSPFSNFHPAKFEYKDLTFISNEQFMMYSKAKSFGDEVSAEKILAINNEPLAQKFINGEISREEITKDKELSAQWQNLMMKAKKLGRGVKNYDESFWESRKYKIVLFGARLKFNQNQELKDIILNTGETKMIESNPYDKVWACGLSEYDAKRTPESKWPGRNLLGKILDELKIEFNNEPVKKFKP